MGPWAKAHEPWPMGHGPWACFVALRLCLLSTFDRLADRPTYRRMNSVVIRRFGVSLEFRRTPFYTSKDFFGLPLFSAIFFGFLRIPKAYFRFLKISRTCFKGFLWMSLDFGRLPRFVLGGILKMF